MNKKEKKVLLRGVFTDEKCPKCKNKLVENPAGEKWCSALWCDYGVVDFNRPDTVLAYKTQKQAAY